MHDMTETSPFINETKKSMHVNQFVFKHCKKARVGDDVECFVLMLLRALRMVENNCETLRHKVETLQNNAN